MASSRWKRFAFFDRSNLQLSNAVLDDLIPGLDATASGRRVVGVNDADTVCMRVCSAGLPLHAAAAAAAAAAGTSNAHGIAANAKPAEETSTLLFYKSLRACSALQTSTDDDVVLPSQSTNRLLPSTAKQTVQDGLILCWLTSAETDLVHCVDLTQRCSGKDGEQDTLDGWRGYYSAFPVEPPKLSSTRLEDRILSEHLAETNSTGERVIGLATTREANGTLLLACISDMNVVVHVDPHLHLNCRLPLSHSGGADRPLTFPLVTPWTTGHATSVDVQPGFVAVGNDMGGVVVYQMQRNFLRPWLTLPGSAGVSVSSVKLHLEPTKVSLFVCYHRLSNSRSAGVCCFDLGSPNGNPTAALGRHDLDSRQVMAGKLVDFSNHQLTIGRPDGLYTYSTTSKTSVAPIDGVKLCISVWDKQLVASTDLKSGRDAVDIYDATNKLVAFHVLLSPGHMALRSSSITTPFTRAPDGGVQGGRSSAIVITSGGAILTLTEKETKEKISLLVQKNLYGAAISMAYEDKSVPPTEITMLYRKHAEHLYRKGDYTNAMDQYIYTIGSLESSHIILRYLDAPKIPVLVKYLEELRSRKLATPVHNELLRTCYLKLNDSEAAEKIAAASGSRQKMDSAVAILANLSPKEGLATVCSLDAAQATEALVVHGATLARALPRETAGIVVSLCVGTYSPTALAHVAVNTAEASKLLEYATDDRPKSCTPYPVHLFTSAFLENPKMLRLILAHCNRNRCPLTPSLRRTLLELTLEEWNNAKRTGDTEAEKLRRKEAITALTDAQCREIGDYDALVIVQLAGFAEGELLLYERLQMVPMLLARYAQDGGDRARRQMLAMGRKDPEILADVLGHFVEIASEKINHDREDDSSISSEEEGILDDIREALTLAKAQGVLPPVRIARILAGEGVGQFSSDVRREQKQTVPLSVALDYVGDILDDSRREITKLKAEVEEYNDLCNAMELEVDTLLSGGRGQGEEKATQGDISKINIDDMYARLKLSLEEGPKLENRTVQSREAFWREMNQSEDRFETIARFFAKGVIQ
jgi:hypothetical protein